MCIGGSQKTPDPTPAPDPTPVPTPTVVNPLASAQDRAKNLQSYRYGLASTIKTSSGGITGRGADLKAPSITGVSTLGGIQ